MPLRTLAFIALSLLCTSLSPACATAQTVVSATVPGRYLLAYRGGIVPSDVAARTGHAGATLVSRHPALGVAVVQVQPGSDSAAVRRQLLADPTVAAVIADRIVTASSLRVQALPADSNTAANTADSLYNSPQGWAVRLVGGQGSMTSFGPWTVTHGAGVRIAILDSGIDATHPDLAPNLALNLSEIDQTAATGLPSACDDGTPQDQTGHGTWTASLAAGALGPATGMVAGVAPGTTLFNIKVLERLPGAISAADPTGCANGQAGGLLSWVLKGIEDAVAQRADIISMSLGSVVDVTTGDGAGLKALFDQVTYAAAQAGVLLIASAGNDGLGFGTAANSGRYLELPAQSRDVLAITGTTNPDCAENLAAGAACAPGPVTLPYYANFGPALDALAAPGGSYPQGAGLSDPSQPSGWITGACSAGTAGQYGCFGLGHTAYVQAMGTSASAPLAAGVAALIWSVHPGWTAQQVVAQMRDSAVAYPGLPAAMVSAAAVIKPADLTAAPVLTEPVNFTPAHP